MKAPVNITNIRRHLERVLAYNQALAAVFLSTRADYGKSLYCGLQPSSTMIWILPDLFCNNGRNVIIFFYNRLSLCYLQYYWILWVFQNLMSIHRNNSFAINFRRAMNGVKCNAVQLG